MRSAGFNPWLEATTHQAEKHRSEKLPLHGKAREFSQLGADLSFFNTDPPKHKMKIKEKMRALLPFTFNVRGRLMDKCPFCGENEAIMHKDSLGDCRVICDARGCRGPKAGKGYCAVWLWNQRAGKPPAKN